MRRFCLAVTGVAVLAGLAFSASVGAADVGPYARIAILRPHDGKTVDFEAGYIRHLDWHQKAGDKWSWYGWSIWAGERQRWFVYASFGHTAASLANPVQPLEDERDNILNVTPHCEFAGNAVYEFLPALSHGNAVPQVSPRSEFTTVELKPGASKAFEAALATAQPKLQGETLWYRMVAGASVPRYLRIRSRQSLAVILDEQSEQALPDSVNSLIVRATIDIGNLRPTMSYNLEPARQ